MSEDYILRDGVVWIYRDDGYTRFDDPEGMKYGVIICPSKAEWEYWNRPSVMRERAGWTQSSGVS
jgi:hypothetical protein